jgi:hypothetical protein
MTLRELDQRSTDGLVVTLLWDTTDDTVVLQLDDHGATGTCTVPAHQALDAFQHPFVYVTPTRPAAAPEPTDD